MNTEDRRGPPGRTAGAGDPADRFEKQCRVALQTAPLLGLQHLEVAGLVEIGDRRVGNPAQILGLLISLTQTRQ